MRVDLRAPRRLLITGGAGFIGSAVVRAQLARADVHVLTLDKLTYAGHAASLRGVPEDRHRFVQGDICDRQLLDRLFAEFEPDAVVHLAAETHVDRSVDDPAVFVQTNLIGTFTLLEAARQAWRGRDDVLFHHVSTDEVFGSLGPTGRFDLDTAYDPSNPYSATKAGSDHMVAAWSRTYGLPVTTSNCTNNYGPRQFPEKLVPLVIRRALRGESLPLYGDGAQVRDWLHVEDHAAAIDVVLRRGAIGCTYLMSSERECSNLELVRAMCEALQLRRPRPGGYVELIARVPDRPGHDRRYAMDSASTRALGWAGARPLDEGLKQTVDWYLAHEEWLDEVLSDSGYDGQRLGLDSSD